MTLNQCCLMSVQRRRSIFMIMLGTITILWQNAKITSGDQIHLLHIGSYDEIENIITVRCFPRAVYNEVSLGLLVMLNLFAENIT